MLMRSRKSSVAEQSFTQEIYEDFDFDTKKTQKKRIVRKFYDFFGKNLLIFFIMVYAG